MLTSEGRQICPAHLVFDDREPQRVNHDQRQCAKVRVLGTLRACPNERSGYAHCHKAFESPRVGAMIPSIRTVSLDSATHAATAHVLETFKLVILVQVRKEECFQLEKNSQAAILKERRSDDTHENR